MDDTPIPSNAKSPRSIAISLIHEKDAKLVDIITINCSICKDTFKKPLKYIIRAIKRTNTFICRSCSNKQTATNPAVRAKIIATSNLLVNKTKRSENAKKQWEDQNFRSLIASTIKERANSKEGRESRRQQAIKAWQGQPYRQLIIASGKASPRGKLTEEGRNVLSRTTLSNWSNPKLVERYKVGSLNGYIVASSKLKSKPHKLVESILTSLDIKYRSEVLFNKYFADIYLEEYKLVIEVNGNYWHSIPKNVERDKRKLRLLESMDLSVMYIWEHELEDILNVILRILQQLGKSNVINTIA